MDEKSKKLKEVNLTLQEWLDALRMPTPVRNKKKYRRKKKHKNINFFVSDSPSEACDFSIMNGTYNFAVYENLKLWEKYVEYNLTKCFQKSDKGMIFSLQQAKYSEIVNSIYYVNKDLMQKKLMGFVA